MEQITIKEVAKLCGVGVSTVSRAINNHPDINEETKKKVMDIIKEYNYVPNNSARNLKRIDSNTIAVLVKEVSNPFWGKMLEALEREVTERKYSFVLQNVEDEQNEVDVAVLLQKEKRLKGIVFLGGMFNYDDEQLAQLTVPFVLCGSGRTLPHVSKKCAIVTSDGAVDSYVMVDYLCKCGHKKIVLLTVSDNGGLGTLHLEGYIRALKENGITYDEKLVINFEKTERIYTIQNGYEATVELLNSGLDFTCIYAISDTLAIGACRAIFDSGKKVPEDYSVAGLDGLDIAEYYRPSITTMFKYREKIAKESIKTLFALIDRKEVERVRMINAKLIERESTSRI